MGMTLLQNSRSGFQELLYDAAKCCISREIGSHSLDFYFLVKMPPQCNSHTRCIIKCIKY